MSPIPICQVPLARRFHDIGRTVTGNDIGIDAFIGKVAIVDSEEDGRNVNPKASSSV